MQNYRKEMSGKVMKMVWQCRLEQSLFCSLAALHFLEQRLSTGAGVTFKGHRIG